MKMGEREFEMVARALLDMFGDEATDRAQEMIDQRQGTSDGKGLDFWKRVQSEIRRVLAREGHSTST